MHIRNALLLLAATAATAQAQTRPELPRNDMAISLGWFGAEYPGLDRYNRWHKSLFSGAGAGHYWNDHFKSEVEAAWLSRVAANSYEAEDLPGGLAYVRSNYRFQTVKVSLSQLYQFGRNEWVHPYLGAGADVDYLRSAEERPAQTVSVFVQGRGNPVAVSKLSERESSIRAHPFVRGGLKMYASDRVFFTTELKFGFGPGLQQTLWKTGFGVDF